jgi:hypothetical protein
VTSGDCLENLFSSISGGGGGGGGGGAAAAFRSQVTPGNPILLCYQEVLLLATPYLF